jgi:hypothetical protein
LIPPIDTSKPSEPMPTKRQPSWFRSLTHRS